MSMKLKLDPDLAEQLDVLLDQPLRDPGKTAEGRRAFLEQAQELGKNLLMEKSFALAVTTEDPPRHNRWMHLLQTVFSTNFKKERSPMFGVLGTILLIVSLVVGGSGVTVAAAQNSLPDQPLYAVKTWSEDARAGLTENTQHRLELALQYTQRRSEEIQMMLQAGQTPPETVETRMQAEIERALELAAGQPDNQAAREFAQIRQQLSHHAQAFSHLGPQADPQAEALRTRIHTMLQERLQVCDEGVQDPEMARQHLRNRNHPSPLSGTPTGQGNPWTTGTPTPGSGYGPGPGDGSGGNNPWTTGTPTPGSGYGPGGNNPWTTGTPTPGSGYGPGGNNPWTTGTPTPGSGYGPGPGGNGGNDGSGGNGSGNGSGSGTGNGSGNGSGSGSGSGSGNGSGNGGNGGRH